MAEAQANPKQNIYIEFMHQAEEIILVSVLVLSAIGYLSDHIEKFSKNVAVQVSIYIAVAAIISSLYFFTIRPLIIKKRELNLRPKGEPDENYFTTSPRSDDRYHFFDSGYAGYLNWLKDIKAPLLYLTGPSGSGKSSLINAYLAPQLKSDNNLKTHVHLLRSYREPLKVLYEALTEKKADTDINEELVFKELQKVASQLPVGERILIVLDQFEEFFLLRNTTGEMAQNDEIKNIEELKNFFHRFISSTPASVYILLSYRDDFQQLIDQLELPARNEHINFEQVKLLSFEQASRFLKNCPGMEIPEMQLDNILKEAASIDTPVALRPIVLNLLGIILKRMVSQKSLLKKHGNLIRYYILDCLGKELQNERARMLREMLSDFHTARPRTVHELSHSTKLTISQLDNQMVILQHYGLVRCLDTTENSQAKRKWQIAHDFVAVQLEKVVYSISKVFWKMARPWVAPTMICVMGIIISSYYAGNDRAEKDNALTKIENAELKWTETSKTIGPGNLITLNDSSLQSILPYFIVLQPEVLDITFILPSDSLIRANGNNISFKRREKFSNFSGLDKVKSLKKISIVNNDFLKSLSGLSGLPALATINLFGCSNLETLDDIENLQGLKELNISNNAKKFNPEAIKKASRLTRLYLYNCESQIVNYISGLKNLNRLTLGNCTGFKNLDSINNLTAIDTLSFIGCIDLHDLKGIGSLKKLTSLNLTGCTGLKNLDALETSNSLKELIVTGCSATIDSLGQLLKKKLPNLQRVVGSHDDKQNL